MSVLVEEKFDSIESGDGNVNDGVCEIEHGLMEWHPVSGLLALTTYNSNIGTEINFLTHQATRSAHLPIRKTHARITQLTWHPVVDIIATSWDSGDVIFRFMQSGQDCSLPAGSIRSGKVQCMLWSVSVDPKICIVEKDGNIVFWKIISDGKRKAVKSIFNCSMNEEAICICRKIPQTKSIAQENDVKINRSGKEPHPKTSWTEVKNKSNEYFIIGSASGGIYAVHHDGEIREIYRMDTAVIVIKILYIKAKALLLTLSQGLFLHQLLLFDDDKVEEKIRVKISGKLSDVQIITMGTDVFAMCSGENQIRIWDFKNEESGTVSLRTAKGFSSNDVITCISYSNIKDCLSGGTPSGKIANWKHSHITDETIDKQWILQEAVNIDSSIAVLQSGPKKITLVCLESVEKHDIQVSVTVKGLHISEKCLALWDGQQVFLYEVINEPNTKLKILSAANFYCSTSNVAVYQQNVYCIENDKIKIRTFQGMVKQIISMPEMEGNPLMIDTNNSWMCLVNSNGFIRIYDLSSREVHQQYHPKCISKVVQNFECFLHVKLNKLGNRVSFTYYTDNDKNIHPGIMVWDADSDVVSNFNFITGMTDQQQYEVDGNNALSAVNPPNTAAMRKIEKEQAKYRLPDYLPGFHCWDNHDSRYLICEGNHRKSNAPNYLLLIFITSEDGLHVQGLQMLSRNSEILLGCSVPYIYSVRRDTDGNEIDDNEKYIGNLILRQVLREFIGLESSDAVTKEAMMNFSYYMTVGKMDEAFKAIKFIKSESAWENMAHMCVKTRRLDVALICLGNMGHACGARALRKSMQNDDPVEVQVATLAIQLGLLNEAQALFASCGRYDLVNRLLQSQNRWDEAFKVAEEHDRIHLRNTYYNYANHLESLGSIDNAIENYEKSGTHRFEVPRMLFDHPKMLEAYVKKTKDPGIQKWWAQYMESQGDVKAARMYYQYAKDYLSVVRLLCCSNNSNEAVEIAHSTGDKAACYHLGQYFETHGDPNMAVTFFTKAHAFSNALRLAKEHNMKDKIANLALMAGGNELFEAAQYYENVPGQADKAVMLYHKAGMISRALDLAFRTEQFSALDLIANELDEHSDPRTLERAAEFFENNQQYEKAVRLLAYSKKYSEAINLCKQRNVPMSVTLAEALTPVKEDIPNQADWLKLLESIAECCVQQRNYHFAAKKYIQAGNKLEAMRSLVKSGDTQKIIFFATAARNKEIYILAANYLQTLNWKEDGVLMKQIESFYNKANAYKHLSSFYEACAQVEIDDYRDYGKAIDALNEALHCTTKALQISTENDEYLTQKQVELYQTIGNIKEFIQIRTIYELDSTDAVRQLEALADNKEACRTVRLGDIYAVMIMHNVHKTNYRKAYSLIQQLKEREPSIELSRYVDKEIQDIICDEIKEPRLSDNEKKETKSSEDEYPDSDQVGYSYAMKRIGRDSTAYDEK